MPRTSLNQRFRALGMLNSGASVSAATGQFGVSGQPVRWWLHHYQTTATVSDPPRSARPRVTTQHQDRYITVTHRRSRFQPATVTAGTVPGLKRMSSGTVPEPFQWARPTRKTPCCSSTHSTQFFYSFSQNDLLSKWNADESGGGNYPWQWRHLKNVFVFEQLNEIASPQISSYKRYLFSFDFCLFVCSFVKMKWWWSDA